MEKSKVKPLNMTSRSIDETLKLEEKIALESKNLELWYGDFQALRDINLKVNENSVCALIGPSGCGKSTFLRCINRLNEEFPNVKIDGEINFMGENIYGGSVDPVMIRRNIGMVFQQPNPFPSMSIYENVISGVKINGLAPKKEWDDIVENALKKAALWDEVKDKLKKPGSSLSGGQQQRLCIARAIAPNPKILLMDEPTSALDPIATAKIEELVKELKKDYTVVIVTHNMQQAARVSDQVCFFVLGDLLEVSETAKFFNNPCHPKSKEYVAGDFG